MKKALLVIDVQSGFVTKLTSDLPDKISQYIKVSSFDFVIFTKFVNNEHSSVSQYLGWRKMMTEPETEIHPLLVPLINPDHVFEKDTYSAFKAPGLIEFLKTYDITDITVCGIDTDACILATLFDGFDKGYNIRALTELCGSNSGKSLHDAALAVINRNLQ